MLLFFRKGETEFGAGHMGYLASFVNLGLSGDWLPPYKMRRRLDDLKYSFLL